MERLLFFLRDGAASKVFLLFDDVVCSIIEPLKLDDTDICQMVTIFVPTEPIMSSHTVDMYRVTALMERFQS